MEKRFEELYSRIGYPQEWLQEAEGYAPADSYVIFDPAWAAEPVPEIPTISIYDLFNRAVERSPRDTAIVFLDRAATYEELDLMINKYASLLLKLGVKKGDVVATMLPNSLQHWIAFYGAGRIGAVHTPINVMYRDEEIAYQLNDSGAKTVVALDLFYNLHFEKVKQRARIDNVIITNIHDFAPPDYQPPQSLKLLWDAPKTRPEGTLDLFEAIEQEEPVDIEVECDPQEDVALLLYTAGTTGVPKGVMETHFNLVFNSLTHAHLISVSAPREVNYSIMPMFHTAGYFLHTLPAFYKGGTVIPIPLFDLEDTLRIIQQYAVNTLFAPPTFFIALLQHPALGSYDLSSLEFTIGCGAPVPTAIQEQWQKTARITLTNGWGMTETNCGGCISMIGVKEKLDSIGVPVCAEVKIVGDEGEVLSRGEVGEILFRGLQVAKGYWNKLEETAQTFQPDGWMRTGDLGYVDEEDFVHLVDRKKDLIIASGYNIAPVEVENVIYCHPAVAEVAVVGVPHEYRGETVKAVIVLKEGHEGKVTEQEILDFCSQRLASFKVPKVVEFRDQLPKNAVGKILRRVVREEALRDQPEK